MAPRRPFRDLCKTGYLASGANACMSWVCSVFKGIAYQYESDASQTAIPSGRHHVAGKVQRPGVYYVLPGQFKLNWLPIQFELEDE